MADDDQHGRHGVTARPEPRVLVVEHETNAGIGLVGERLDAAGVTVVTVGPERGKAVPHSAEDFNGVIVLGGLPGPADDDEAPWLPDVRALIAWCLESETPLLGSCLGAQMLAYVAGGTVAGVRNGPEVGVCSVDFMPAARQDAVLESLPAEACAVQWHWLEIIDLPGDAVLLGSSGKCPNQAFRIGPCAWGVQFHLEALAPTVAAWARSDRDDLRDLGLTSSGVIDDARRKEPLLRETWATVADRWIDVVRRREGTAAGTVQ
ncbi:type 1 glutamine amidotransferase [Spelaeicoccus albus]|uniref:GMP synthase-like glutamine amidotransferase n=1 Tax=Spelaeicoccus albus TaxID=1280376 RepID=A0A7Z0IHQ6_9MICO|nr:type 1 glutamine amidotransferase [Spelaeicoccus albus]NYI67791.1 GMP synthase-like glutamine amidotransferase [Spelaeicoccus albus]